MTDSEHFDSRQRIAKTSPTLGGSVAEQSECLGDGVCTNPRCSRHGLGGEIERSLTEQSVTDLGWVDMPSPTEEQRQSPEFEALWQLMKSWDVNVPEYYEGYCGVNGSHVVLVLNALAGCRSWI